MICVSIYLEMRPRRGSRSISTCDSDAVFQVLALVTVTPCAHRGVRQALRIKRDIVIWRGAHEHGWCSASQSQSHPGSLRLSSRFISMMGSVTGSGCARSENFLDKHYLSGRDAQLQYCNTSSVHCPPIFDRQIHFTINLVELWPSPTHNLTSTATTTWSGLSPSSISWHILRWKHLTP